MYIFCRVLYDGFAGGRLHGVLSIMASLEAYASATRVKLIFSQLNESDAAILGASALVWELK